MKVNKLKFDKVQIFPYTKFGFVLRATIYASKREVISWTMPIYFIVPRINPFCNLNMMYRSSAKG